MWNAAAVAFATVFVAELGDKSQLLALSLAARYRRRVLLPAVLAASTLTIGLSVAAGTLVGRAVPAQTVTAVSGALFLVFAALALRSALTDGDDEDDPRLGGRSGFVAAVAALTLAELGDKTMVASFALAASTSAVGVWLGGSLGMAAASALAVLAGAAVWRRLRPRTVRLASAALFAAVGIWLLVEALVG